MAVLDALIGRKAREAVRVLSRTARVRGAYVFGSHLEGKADTWSDIDIAVFVEGVESWDVRQRARAAASVQKEVGDDVELHIFPADALISPPPASFAAYVIRHGARVPDEEEGECDRR